MSREFGSNRAEFFHDKIRACISDIEEEALCGQTISLKPLFEDLYILAYAISSLEAGDWGEEDANKTIKEQLKKIKNSIKV
jgi:hypothetical protein